MTIISFPVVWDDGGGSFARRPDGLGEVLPPMITKQQYRKLMSEYQETGNVTNSAMRAGLAAGEAALRRQSGELAKLKAENDRLAKAAAGISLLQNQMADLRRLQNEVGTLRRRTSELAGLHAENRQLRARTGLDRPKPAGQIQAESRAKTVFVRKWLGNCIRFASAHGGQYPTGFDQMPFVSPAATPVSMQTSSVGGVVTTNEIEIVYGGTLSGITNPATSVVMREKEAWNAGATSHPPNRWGKIYGFADAHVEIHFEMDNNFDDYEHQHIMGAPGQPQ